MDNRYITLYKEQQPYLKQAIERAVRQKFGPDSRSFKSLLKKEKDKLAREFGLTGQTLEKYFNGGDKISCYPHSLNSLSKYVGEVDWDEYVEKCIAEAKKSESEQMQRGSNPGQSATVSPRETVLHLNKDLTQVAPKAAESPDDDQKRKQEKRDKAERNIKLFIFLLLAFAVALFFISRKVRNTAIRAELIVSSVTFVLNSPAEFSKIQAKRYLRIDSAVLYGAPFLDGTKNKLIANAVNGDHQVSIEQLNIPSGFRVTFENPIKNQLFIKLLADKSATQTSIEGKITNYENLVINKIDTVKSDSIKSLTKAITFKTSLKQNESFELAVVDAGATEIPWMIIKEIRFQTKENFYDVKSSSSIIRGRVLFTETSDSISLEKFDDLTVTLSKPIRLSLAPKEDGVHVNFSGDVRQLSVGSEYLDKPQENLMPQFYNVLIASIPVSLWTIIGAILSFLVSVLAAMKKKNKKNKVIIVTLLLGAIDANAQINNVDLYRANTVRIETGIERGSGFICSKAVDSVFILTANHVVEKTKDTIHVTIRKHGTFVGKLLFADSSHDLAMLGIQVKDFAWTPAPIAKNVELGDQVFFITLSEVDQPLLPRGRIATIDKWDFEKGIQFVGTNAVVGGDSGGALLCENGIAGMILTDQVKALDIKKAKQLILAWDKTKWQLIE